jgi:hypothetical protein
MEISAILDDTIKLSELLSGAHRIRTKCLCPCISYCGGMTRTGRKTRQLNG